MNHEQIEQIARSIKLTSPAGMVVCPGDGCGRFIPDGHALCDWCAAKHIRKQMGLDVSE